MHRKMKRRAALAALALTISCTATSVWSAAPALADSGSGSCGSTSSGGSSGGGSGSGGDYQIWEALTYKNTDYLCSSGGNVTSGGADTSVYVPCWWGPEYSPSELQAYVDGMGESAIDTQFDFMHEYDSNGDAAGYTAGYQSTDGPLWESYNVGASPAGEWYGLIFNAADTSAQMDTCQAGQDAKYPEDYYWGVNGNPPADLPGNAPGFTEQDLADYLESIVVLPPAVMQSSQGKDASADTVNLPIWYWQDEGTPSTLVEFDECAFQVCVHFRAQAVSFTVRDDTTPAEIDSSGCTDQPSTNTLGTPYTDQPLSQAPSCGVTYTERSAATDPVAETTWNVAITWDGGSLVPTPPPVIGTPIGGLPVQDVQAVNQATATP